MPLTEPDLWISHIRLFDSSHATRTSRTGTVLLHRPVPAKAYGAPFAYSDIRKSLSSVVSISVYGILRLFPLRQTVNPFGWLYVLGGHYPVYSPTTS